MSLTDSEKAKRSSRIDQLEAEVESLRDSAQRLRDGQKMAFGALVGVAALLIAFAWHAGHKTYESDKLAMLEELNRANDERQKDFRATLTADAAKQGQMIDNRIAIKWRQLQSGMAASGGNSSNALTRLNEDLTRKIVMMSDQVDQRYGEVAGLTYFNQAIATLNKGIYPASTEYFMSSALAFWQAGDEANVQTCLSRLFQYCLPRLRQRDLIARPSVEEKYGLLVSKMESLNTGGKWQVAIGELRRMMSDVKARK